MNSKDLVKEFIVENFLFGDAEELTSESDFFEKGIIDSTGILELVCFIEESFQTRIEDDELTQQNFSSLNSIESFLKHKLNGKTVL
jgi:acyl carrier protein